MGEAPVGEHAAVGEHVPAMVEHREEVRGAHTPAASDAVTSDNTTAATQEEEKETTPRHVDETPEDSQEESAPAEAEGEAAEAAPVEAASAEEEEDTTTKVVPVRSWNDDDSDEELNMPVVAQQRSAVDTPQSLNTNASPYEPVEQPGWDHHTPYGQQGSHPDQYYGAEQGYPLNTGAPPYRPSSALNTDAAPFEPQTSGEYGAPPPSHPPTAADAYPKRGANPDAPAYEPMAGAEDGAGKPPNPDAPAYEPLSTPNPDAPAYEPVHGDGYPPRSPGRVPPTALPPTAGKGRAGSPPYTGGEGEMHGDGSWNHHGQYPQHADPGYGKGAQGGRTGGAGHKGSHGGYGAPAPAPHGGYGGGSGYPMGGYEYQQGGEAYPPPHGGHDMYGKGAPPRGGGRKGGKGHPQEHIPAYQSGYGKMGGGGGKGGKGASRYQQETGTEQYPPHDLVHTINPNHHTMMWGKGGKGDPRYGKGGHAEQGYYSRSMDYPAVQYGGKGGKGYGGPSHMPPHSGYYPPQGGKGGGKKGPHGEPHHMAYGKGGRGGKGGHGEYPVSEYGAPPNGQHGPYDGHYPHGTSYPQEAPPAGGHGAPNGEYAAPEMSSGPSSSCNEHPPSHAEDEFLSPGVAQSVEYFRSQVLKKDYSPDGSVNPRIEECVVDFKRFVEYTAKMSKEQGYLDTTQFRDWCNRFSFEWADVCHLLNHKVVSGFFSEKMGLQWR